MSKKQAILALSLILSPCWPAGPCLAKSVKDKNLLHGRVYELRSQGFIDGQGVLLDLILDPKDDVILVKKCGVRAWHPAGVLANRTDGTGECSLYSVSRKGSSIVVVGHDAEDTDELWITIRLFPDSRSPGGHSEGLVDLSSSVDTTGDECGLTLRKIHVTVAELKGFRYQLGHGLDGT